MKNMLAPLIAFFCLTFQLFAKETPVSVSVLSNDAKFIGSSMGGAQIVLRNTITGEILANGKTVGSTGDTARIMDHPQSRDHVLKSEGSASFDTTLDLDRPIQVTIEATGPLAQKQATSRITETLTLLPGKNYADQNGIILRLHGMVVDVLAPPAHIKKEGADSIQVEANVMKMCGCPIGEKTPWPIERYSVEAHIYMAGGALLKVVDMTHTGEASQFAAEIPMPNSGVFEIIVTAYDEKSKDSGFDSTTVILQ